MKAIYAMMVLAAAAGAASSAEAQQPQLATFQETAQVLVDRTLTGNVTASITLQSTSNQEITIPTDINRAILDSGRIVSVVYTNQEGCGVLGVSGKNCILVNILRAGNDTNILLVQKAARDHGDRIIGALNELLDSDTRYHSSFLHHRDEINVLLGTSGSVSGRDVVSAVYASDAEDTASMYEKTAALVLARPIRDSGGFFAAAGELAAHENAHMALSIIPVNGTSLYQLRVSSEFGDANATDRLDLLSYLQTDRLERSAYFSGGFYPLNSLLHAVVLSPEDIRLYGHGGGKVPVRDAGGQMVPADLSSSGWIFDSENGTKVEGKYLFGRADSAGAGQMYLVVGPEGMPPAQGGQDLVIAGIIAAAAAGAVVFYLRGYRKS